MLNNKEQIMSEARKDYATALRYTDYCKSLPMTFRIGDSVKVPIKHEIRDSQEKTQKAAMRRGIVVAVTPRFIVVEILGGSESWRTAFTGFDILQGVKRG